MKECKTISMIACLVYTLLIFLAYFLSTPQRVSFCVADDTVVVVTQRCSHETFTCLSEREATVE